MINISKLNNKEITYYNNKNGTLTIKEMIEIKKQGKVKEYIKNFKVTRDKCPPNHLRHLGEMKQCFYCVDCLYAAFKQVKINT